MVGEGLAVGDVAGERELEFSPVSVNNSVRDIQVCSVPPHCVDVQVYRSGWFVAVIKRR